MPSRRKSRSKSLRSQSRLSKSRRSKSRSASRASCSHRGGKVIGVAILHDSGVLGQGRIVSGEIVFQEEGRRVVMSGEVRGLLPNGVHAIHLHEAGDLRPGGCAGACSHFNPHHRNHGGLTGRDRHVGDFGNLKADCHGVARLNSTVVSGVKLRGKNSILGRSVVVHLKEDDLGKGGTKESLTTGSAGARIACGVVGYSQESALCF